MNIFQQLATAIRIAPSANAHTLDTFRSTAHSETGPYRAINEDRYFDGPELGVWAVADGMGGHRDGERAAEMVIDAIKSAAASPGFEAIKQALLNANKMLRLENNDAGLSGATVAVLKFEASRWRCLWAGDCRVYRLRAGVLQLLTRDHTEVNRLVDEGLLTEEQAEMHPQRNVVTRAVGARDDLVLDEIEGDLNSEDIFLTCSDGLADSLHFDLLEKFLTSKKTPAAAFLVERAVKASGADNITAIVVKAGR